MLPSKGYFTNNRCLFYDAGSCDRPYCHYRHAKKGQVTDESRECVEQSIRSIEDRFEIKIDNAKVITETVIIQLEYQVNKGESVEAASKATYKPTPINILRQYEESSSSTHRHIPIQNTQIYRPPIRATKLSHQTPLTSTFGFGSYQTYSPTSLSSAAAKPEYVPTSKSSNGSAAAQIEYDPTNYVPIPVDSKKYVPTSSEVPKKKTTEKYVPIQIKTNNDMESVDYNPTEISTIMENADTHYLPESCQSNHNNEQDVDYTPSVIEGTVLIEDLKQTAEIIEDDLDFINDILDDDTVHGGQKDQKKVPKHVKIAPDKNDKENSKRKKESNLESKHHHSSSKYIEQKSSKTKPKHEKLKSSSSKAKSHHDSSSSSHPDKSKTDKSSSSKSSSKSDHYHKSSKHPHRSKSSHSKESLTAKIESKRDKGNEDKKGKEKKEEKKEQREGKKEQREEKIQSSKSFSKPIRKSSSDTSTKPKSNDTDRKETPQDSKTMFFIPQDDMFSEDDIEAQCRKIFEDNSKTPTSVKATKRPREESSEEVDVGRKRVAHPNQINTYSKSKPTLRPNFQVESSKMLIERYKLNHCKVPTEEQRQSISVPNTPNSSKVRIAHVPNVNKLISTKSKITTTTKSKTIIEKARDRLKNKTAQEILTDRPTCKDPENTKIPYHIRSLILNNMIDACLDMYLYPESAYERAKNEEYTVFDKCRSLAVYKSSAKLAVHRLQVQAKGGIVLDDPGSSASSNNNKKRKDSQEKNLYNQIKKWVLSESELRAHGFPRSHHDSSLLGAAIINAPQKITVHKEIDEKVCCRCHKVYKIDEFGFQLHPEECIYHYKRRYRFRGESKYGCCSGTDEYGCTSAPCHVNDELDTENLRGYVKTIDTSDIDSVEQQRASELENEDYGIYALDCEMSYTTAGIELTRITVIDRKCEVVYETIVKPFHPIIDYNTRFSGIEASHMEGVTTTLLHVQANLLHLFNSRTILIGHSLESDFKALKLIHNTVIDTSVMFPHKMGLPFKRALKTLAYDFLKKIIQNQISGHDSAEDAVTCMELVLWKVNEDMKLSCCS